MAVVYAFDLSAVCEYMRVCKKETRCNLGGNMNCNMKLLMKQYVSVSSKNCYSQIEYGKRDEGFSLV